MITALLTHWVEIINRATNLRKYIVQPRLDKELSEKGEPSSTDLWDALVVPGSAAIWSASALFARGKTWQRNVSPGYLFILKIASAFIHYLFPFGALVIISIVLFSDLVEFAIWPVIFIVSVITVIVALVQLCQAGYIEYQYYVSAKNHLKEIIAKAEVPNK